MERDSTTDERLQFAAALLTGALQTPKSMRVVSVDVERRVMVFEFTVDEDITNRGGNLYGGAAASLTDGLSAIALAVFTKSMSVTTDLSISFFRPLPAGSAVRAVATVTSAGKRVESATIDFYAKETNKLAASGRHTKLVTIHQGWMIKSKL